MRVLLLAILLTLGLSSCRTIYPNTMFKDTDAVKFTSSINKLKEEYLIRTGDEISLKLYTRKGSSLIEPIVTDVVNTSRIQTNENSTFLVSDDGIIDFPVIGKMKVVGLTENYLKNYLEKEFEKNYQSPFVVLKVENRRAFVFKGTLGAVISLNRTPTSIFEVIAKSGGLDRHMKSSDILIIRGDLKSPSIYKVDLSTFESIKTSETVIQPNDIVYIQERQRPLYYALQDFAPVITIPLSVISTTLTTIFLIITLSK